MMTRWQASCDAIGMRPWQAIGLVAIVVLVVILVLAFVLPARTETRPSSSPVVRPSPSASATSTATATSATSTPSPTPTGLYVNQKYKFSVVLPPPYRRSNVVSIDRPDGQFPSIQDAFTPWSDADEIRLTVNCHTACPTWNYVAFVNVYPGKGSQTLRQFYDSQGGNVTQKFEDATVDGRPALKVTNGVPYPMEYVIKDGDRMLIVGYQIYPPENGMPVPAGGSRDKLEAILASFKFVP
jgi:hypothetical protein